MDNWVYKRLVFKVVQDLKIHTNIKELSSGDDIKKERLQLLAQAVDSLETDVMDG
jgi:hypothetical protein